MSGPAGLPRLLLGIGRRALTLEENAALHGELHGRDRPERLAAEVGRSGLGGCGGAGFPTEAKLRSVARAGGRPVVVVNGCESEPASRKDRLLLERLPHLVLDGALTAARIVGSRTIIVAVEEQASRAADAVALAVAERPELARRGFVARVVGVAGGYLSGQDTALVAALGGAPARPSLTPPYPSERGVGRRPTFVSNVETHAHLALIARHGSGWFRELGSAEGPGSRLVTVAGAVAQPGVVEGENGSPLAPLLAATGGAGEPLRALLVGGYGGTWVQPEYPGPAIGRGVGIVQALPMSACPVAEVARVTAWLAGESAGQCGPCVHGLGSIADALAELTAAGDVSGAYRRVQRWCEMITGRGACAHPDGAARFVSSALCVFAEEFDDHARHGRCEACLRRPVLPLPSKELLAA
ncbi:MAG TPA: NADH-ubiquinone oxidoreductase-F iron-sulfur binding region domain-containing protein [Solirubrobacteraceae bacterium]|jgi:NADH:ubiquinone oxidoreductase subunit F (NADH-binding)|nr:NADH-ubiquinone oxidoreductase-F iron-sulfur binding region domain-containing protein [Solirubrobacteraceae bacterium]